MDSLIHLYIHSATTISDISKLHQRLFRALLHGVVKPPISLSMAGEFKLTAIVVESGVLLAHCLEVI